MAPPPDGSAQRVAGAGRTERRGGHTGGVVEPTPPPRTSTARRIAIGAVLTLVVMVVLVVLTFGPARDRDLSNLGADVFEFRAVDLASRIAEDGRPRLFADLVGSDRPIWVNHLGTDPEAGWYAVGAIAPGPPEDCVVDWVPEAAEFEDCEGRRYPDTGDGLTPYPVVVDGSVASIDLNFDERAAADIAAP